MCHTYIMFVLHLNGVVVISSTLPIDLGEGGGRTNMRNKRWQVQNVFVAFPAYLWNFLKCLGPGAENVL